MIKEESEKFGIKRKVLQVEVHNREVSALVKKGYKCFGVREVVDLTVPNPVIEIVMVKEV
jgi:hypothetical protein